MVEMVFYFVIIELSSIITNNLFLLKIANSNNMVYSYYRTVFGNVEQVPCWKPSGNFAFCRSISIISSVMRKREDGCGK